MTNAVDLYYLFGMLLIVMEFILLIFFLNIILSIVSYHKCLWCILTFEIFNEKPNHCPNQNPIVIFYYFHFKATLNPFY